MKKVDNPSTKTAYMRKYRASIPNYDKRANLKKCYGLSLEQFEALLESQGGVCAICRENRGRMCVDHCHRNGTIRGILCTQCNAMLGMAADRIATLEEAIRYLKK